MAKINEFNYNQRNQHKKNKRNRINETNRSKINEIKITMNETNKLMRFNYTTKPTDFKR